MRVGHHGSWCIRVFWHQVGTNSSSTISESGIPHSLSGLAYEFVGLSLKRLHAAFYGGERLFAHHSVLLVCTTPPCDFYEWGPPEVDRDNWLPTSFELQRNTQSVQRQQPSMMPTMIGVVVIP